MIAGLAKANLDDREAAALAAGRRIAAGSRARTDFLAIFGGRPGPRRSRPARNGDAEIATRSIWRWPHDRAAAIAVLTGLAGVEVLVAPRY